MLSMRLASADLVELIRSEAILHTIGERPAHSIMTSRPTSLRRQSVIPRAPGVLSRDLTGKAVHAIEQQDSTPHVSGFSYPCHAAVPTWFVVWPFDLIESDRVAGSCAFPHRLHRALRGGVKDRNPSESPNRPISFIRLPDMQGSSKSV